MIVMRLMELLSQSIQVPVTSLHFSSLHTLICYVHRTRSCDLQLQVTNQHSFIFLYSSQTFTISHFPADLTHHSKTWAEKPSELTAYGLIFGN